MGEHDRLAQLVMQRLAALTLFARQWLDAASAEDVVQETLTTLLMQRKSPDDPVAWMFRAVRNAAIDHCRTSPTLGLTRTRAAISARISTGRDDRAQGASRHPR